MNDTLPQAISSQLLDLECVISKNAKAFIETGEALKTIRDEKLYRQRGFKTFEEYCEKQWRFKRAQAYRLIDGANVVSILSPNGDISEPIMEGHVRPLTRLLSRVDSQQAIRVCMREAQQAAKQEGKSTSQRHVESAIVRHYPEHSAAAKKEGLQFSPIIKPTDNWNFDSIVYGRIDESGESHGYIPGEIYANVFWYYAPNGGEVCDLMAGSGQAKRVYDDRLVWGKGRDIEFNLRMFDRLPRGKYKDYIEQLDATKGLPDGYHPDLIFMDVPYFGMVKEAYSSDIEDIANMGWDEWRSAMNSVAAACSKAQQVGARCIVMAPKTADWKNGRIMVRREILRAWEDVGYVLVDEIFSSRRIQQNPDMRFLNNRAKEKQLMLSDMVTLQVFERG